MRTRMLGGVGAAVSNGRGYPISGQIGRLMLLPLVLSAAVLKLVIDLRYGSLGLLSPRP
ncbi:MAG: hypothetical protein KDA57_22995 [Planctomycetales bacterium]|nr:hypothetical protein [Planctomycetales bacterium]